MLYVDLDVYKDSLAFALCSALIGDGVTIAKRDELASAALIHRSGIRVVGILVPVEPLTSHIQRLGASTELQQ